MLRGRSSDIGLPANYRVLAASLLFALLYSLSLQLGLNLSNTGTLLLSEASTWIKVLFLSACITLCLYLFLTAVCTHRFRFPISRPFFMLSYPFFTTWIAIIVAWLPIIIARWPGDFSFDAMWQTAYIIPDKTNLPEYWSHLNAWHPPLHSLWLGGSLYLGWSFFSSYSVGLAFYTVTQTLFFSFCLAKITSVVYESGQRVLYLFSLLFACLFSGFSVYVTMTTKDVAFSGIFSLSVLWVFRTVRDSTKTIANKAWLAKGFALFLLSMLLRNNALHAYLLFAVILVVANLLGKMEIKVFLLPLLSAICFLFLITGPIYNAFNIEPGPAKEAMSVPSVQIASVMNDHMEELSQEDIAYITQLVPDWEKYNHNLLADETKMRFDTSLVASDPLRFLDLYCRLAIRYPGNYIHAWSLLTAGYWSQSVDYSLSGNAVLSFPLMCPYEAVRGVLPEYLSIPFDEPVPALSSSLNSLLGIRVETHVPIVGLLYKAATWFWLVIATLVISVAFSTPLQRVLPSILLLAYCATLFLGPGSIYRYASPLFVSAPLILLMLSELFKAERTKATEV